METILEHLDVDRTKLPASYAEKMKTLGMKTNDYPVISNEAIFSFLRGRVKSAYPLWNGFRDSLDSIDFDRHGKLVGTDCIYTQLRVHHVVVREESGGFFNSQARHEIWAVEVSWMEVALKDYVGNPPERILTSALKAIDAGYKELYAVTVSPVKEVVLKDPLLIARKDNRRYLIDWWDNDFTAEELNKITV